MTSNQLRLVARDAFLVPFLVGDDEIRAFEAALLELDVADDHLVGVDAPLHHAVDRCDLHHLQAQIAELVRGEEVAVRPAERHPGDARLRLQLREKDEFALVGLARAEDVLHEQGAYRGMRRARLGGDGLEFLPHRGDDLLVDRRRKRLAVGFGGPPPQYVDADGADDDRCENETGDRQANPDAHVRLSLLRGAVKHSLASATAEAAVRDQRPSD